MKNLAVLLLLTLFLACKKEQINGPGNPEILLRETTVNGKTDQSFEYDSNNRLVKENSFSICENNPSDEYLYQYENGKIHKMSSVLRSLYSSTETICNPAAGVHFDALFEYDVQGRISKVVHSGSASVFSYNAAGFIEKQTITSDNGESIFTYEHDASGNIVRETDAQGNVTEYEYDTRKNPFFLMQQKPAFITPFNQSPNNVVKATGNTNFERAFEYNADGFPTQVKETNGLTYLYIYE